MPANQLSLRRRQIVELARARAPPALPLSLVQAALQSLRAPLQRKLQRRQRATHRSTEPRRQSPLILSWRGWRHCPIAARGRLQPLHLPQRLHLHRWRP